MGAAFDDAVAADQGAATGDFVTGGDGEERKSASECVLFLSSLFGADAAAADGNEAEGLGAGVRAEGDAHGGDANAGISPGLIRVEADGGDLTFFMDVSAAFAGRLVGVLLHGDFAALECGEGLLDVDSSSDGK